MFFFRSNNAHTTLVVCNRVIATFSSPLEEMISNCFQTFHLLPSDVQLDPPPFSKTFSAWQYDDVMEYNLLNIKMAK